MTPEAVKWDYKIVLIRDEIDPEKIVLGLNKLGLIGWEVVSFVPKISGGMTYLVLLKRPIEHYQEP